MGNRDRKLFSGTQNLANGEIVPRECMPGRSNFLMNEESQDGHETWEWEFKKTGVVGSNVKFDTDTKYVVLDTSDQKYNVCNQWRRRMEREFLTTENYCRCYWIIRPLVMWW